MSVIKFSRAYRRLHYNSVRKSIYYNALSSPKRCEDDEIGRCVPAARRLVGDDFSIPDYEDEDWDLWGSFTWYYDANEFLNYEYSATLTLVRASDGVNFGSTTFCMKNSSVGYSPIQWTPRYMMIRRGYDADSIEGGAIWHDTRYIYASTIEGTDSQFCMPFRMAIQRVWYKDQNESGEWFLNNYGSFVIGLSWADTGTFLPWDVYPHWSYSEDESFIYVQSRSRPPESPYRYDWGMFQITINGVVYNAQLTFEDTFPREDQELSQLEVFYNHQFKFTVSGFDTDAIIYYDNDHECTLSDYFNGQWDMDFFVEPELGTFIARGTKTIDIDVWNETSEEYDMTITQTCEIVFKMYDLDSAGGTLATRAFLVNFQFTHDAVFDPGPPSENGGYEQWTRYDEGTPNEVPDNEFVFGVRTYEETEPGVWSDAVTYITVHMEPI